MATTHTLHKVEGVIETITAIEIPVDAAIEGSTWDSRGFRVRGSATLKTATLGDEIEGQTLVGFAGERFRAGDADLVALVNAIVDHLSAKADFEAGRDVTEWPYEIRVGIAAEILEGKIPGAGKTAAEQ